MADTVRNEWRLLFHICSARPEKEFSWKMTAAKWINKAAEDATVGIYAYVRVKETGQLFAKKSVLELNKPELEITVSCIIAEIFDVIATSLSIHLCSLLTH